MHLLLQRLTESNEGTQGVVSDLLGNNVCRTLELPWRNNERRISRIEAGTYEVVPHSGTRFKNALKLLDVPGRSHILIHAGNWAGDTSLGFKSDSLGCILPCMTFGTLDGQRAGLRSREALRVLLALQPTLLTLNDGA